MQNRLFGAPPSMPSTSAPARTSVTKAPPSRVDAKAEYEQWRQALDWLGERYEDLHLWVLKRNLHILADPLTGDDERADILAWIEASPDDAQLIDPFSFRACLALYDERCEVAETRHRIRVLNQRVLQRRRALGL